MTRNSAGEVNEVERRRALGKRGRACLGVGTAVRAPSPRRACDRVGLSLRALGGGPLRDLKPGRVTGQALLRTGAVKPLPKMKMMS